MDDYLDSVESPERALKRLKELVHLLYLGRFKLTKFVSNVPNLADRNDGSPHSTEPKVIASSKEDSPHVLGWKRDRNNDTLVVSRDTFSTVTTPVTPVQFVTVKRHWLKPTLLDFNDWLKEKAEAHDLMKNTATKASKEDSSHVLGLKWDHNNDTLVVSRCTSSTVTKSLTQR